MNEVVRVAMFLVQLSEALVVEACLVAALAAGLVLAAKDMPGPAWDQNPVFGE